MTVGISGGNKVAPDDEAIRMVVRAFLARYVDDPEALEQDRLLSDGVLDSLAAAGLIAHLERRFDLEVTDIDLEIENFDSLDAITTFVRTKLCS
ncbi:acyl carrier protein [Oerskovia sp. NPDC060338]|uniref:acyl carrier protein n=1 Tax=Oerskovia sp. NPDC060338 TaxID=3347100 RepID=UPI00365756DB